MIRTGLLSGILVMMASMVASEGVSETLDGIKGNAEPEIVVLDGGMEIPDATPSYNIGSAFFGDPAISKTFTIQNTGTADLMVSTIFLTTGWSEYSVTQEPVSPVTPGGSTTFTIEIDTTSQARTFGATVSFTTNDSNESPYSFGIFGRVFNRATIGLSTSTLEVSAVEGIDAESVSFDVSNVTESGSAQLQYTITENENWMELNRTSGSVVQGNSNTINITFDTASLAPGDYSGTITVSDPAALNSPQDITVNLEVTEEITDGPIIEVRNGMTVIENGITTDQFDSIETGLEDVIVEYTIYNVGTEPLSIDSYDLTGDVFSFSRLFFDDIDPGTTMSLELRLSQYTPAGQYTETFSFATNDPSAPTFSFDLSGEVTAPDPAPDIAIEVDGVEIINGNNDEVFDVGTVMLGEEGPTIFVEVFNRGDGVLKLDALAVPIGFRLGSGFINTVQPGESTASNFVLNTEEYGDFDGSVQFFNNDPEDPRFRFDLSGFVLTPASDLWFID